MATFQRFKLTMQYVGTSFSGCVWQKEPVPTVQTALEKAISHLVTEPPRVLFTSRTDKDVHAFGQVGHIDLTPRKSGLLWCEKSVKGALNYFVRPQPIHILEVKHVDPKMFSARRNAYSRTYVYRIFANCKNPILFEQKTAWLIPNPLNVDKMKEGAMHLIGTHDFSSFRSRGCQALSPVKTINMISIDAYPSPYIVNSFHSDIQSIVITVKAPSFLYHMVRNITGALKAIGSGKMEPVGIKRLLEEKSRANAPVMAPGYGLYLARVDCDEDGSTKQQMKSFEADDANEDAIFIDDLNNEDADDNKTLLER